MCMGFENAAMAASLKASPRVGYCPKQSNQQNFMLDNWSKETYVGVSCSCNILGAGTILDGKDTLRDHLASIGAYIPPTSLLTTKHISRGKSDSPII